MPNRVPCECQICLKLLSSWRGMTQADSELVKLLANHSRRWRVIRRNLTPSERHSSRRWVRTTQADGECEPLKPTSSANYLSRWDCEPLKPTPIVEPSKPTASISYSSGWRVRASQADDKCEILKSTSLIPLITQLVDRPDGLRTTQADGEWVTRSAVRTNHSSRRRNRATKPDRSPTVSASQQRVWTTQADSESLEPTASASLPRLSSYCPS